MLTGNVPFHDDNPMTVIQMHLRAELPPMPQSVPQSVQQLVRRALEKDANRRFQSSGEMMLHAQQAFAELSQQRSVGISGAYPQQNQYGAPPQNQYGAPPQNQYGAPPQNQYGAPPALNAGYAGASNGGGYVSAAPMQKTMMADVSGLQSSGLAPQQSSAPAGGGYMSASPLQKTVVAGMTAPVRPPVGGQPSYGAPYGAPMQPQPVQPMQPMPPPGGGPNKTILLQPSDGIVSVAKAGSPIAVAQAPQMFGQAPVVRPHSTGASMAFWIICLLCGVGLGALAFVIMRQM